MGIKIDFHDGDTVTTIELPESISLDVEAFSTVTGMPVQQIVELALSEHFERLRARRRAALKENHDGD